MEKEISAKTEGEKRILKMSVGEMTGFEYDCSCGRHHKIDINIIKTGQGALRELPGTLEKYRDKTILVVSDENTVSIGGYKVEALLKENGYKVKMLILTTGGCPVVVPNERSMGSVMVNASEDVGLILGVGSGTINDVCKMVSYRMGLDFVIVGTAPSMDGYASVMAPLILEGQKTTLPAHYPKVIITDTDLLNTAPLVMKQAGFGDVIGKYTALTDWRLTHAVNNEHYCATTAELVMQAVNDCVDNMDNYFNGGADAVTRMNDTLLLTGICMGLIGYTRPASGSEHHLAHFWEVDALSKGKEHPLHGNSVGLGSIASAEVYSIMRKRFEIVDSVNPPDPDFLRQLYARAGMALTPKELGIPEDTFYRSLMNGFRIRPRYTIFNFTNDRGMLPEVADEVCRKMCSPKGI